MIVPGMKEASGVGGGYSGPPTWPSFLRRGKVSNARLDVTRRSMKVRSGSLPGGLSAHGVGEEALCPGCCRVS